MDTETKVISILSGEDSGPVEIEGYNCSLVFRRPSLAEKHKAKAWGFSKMKEYGYDPNDDHSGTMVIQYWVQLNSFVKEVFLKDGKGNLTPYTLASGEPYRFVFEKLVVDEIYTAQEKNDEAFIAASIVALAEWLEGTAAPEEEIKNS